MKDDGKRLLVMETSASTGSVAVFEGGACVWEESFGAGRSHSSLLFLALERAMTEVGRPERIIVGLGPGSYAGVRIAICAAIGLGLGTGAEILGACSLAALDEGDYLAVGDARRATYYVAVVRGGVLEGEPRLLTAEALAAERARYADLPVRAGEPVPALEGIFPLEVTPPTARRLGTRVLEGRVHCLPAPLEPLYLREAHITLPGKHPQTA